MYKLKMSPNEIRKRIQIKPEGWQNITTTNCYAYALGLDIRENDICKHAYQPGSMSKILNLSIFFDYFFSRNLIKNIEKDLKTLNISYREIELNAKIETDEWKMALFVGDFFDDSKNLFVSDFHFLRANSVGVWSHKLGYDHYPTKNDHLGKIITNPEKCDLSPYVYQKCYALRLKER